MYAHVENLSSRGQQIVALGELIEVLDVATLAPVQKIAQNVTSPENNITGGIA
jgi:hypothetical protein